MIIKCKCAHTGQDALHGAGLRVANLTLKTEASKQTVRCTVCTTIHPASAEVKK